jgi:hypothetical protein
MMQTTTSVDSSPPTAQQEQAAQVAGIAPSQASTLNDVRLNELENRDAELRAQAAVRQEVADIPPSFEGTEIGKDSGLTTAETADRQVHNMAQAALSEGAAPETISKSAELIRHYSRATSTPARNAEEPTPNTFEPKGPPSNDEKPMAPKAGAAPALRIDDKEVSEPGISPNKIERPNSIESTDQTRVGAPAPAPLPPELARSIENEIAQISAQLRQDTPITASSLAA